MCPKQGLQSCQKHLQAQRERETRLHSTFPRRNGYSRLRQQKEPEEREFVVDSAASVHIVSKRDLNSAELETMRTSRSPNDGDDGQRRGANKRRSDGKRQATELFVKVMLLEEAPAVLSRETLRGSWVFLHWISGQKTSHPKKGKRFDCIKSNFVPFVVLGLSASSSSTAPSPFSPSVSSQDSANDVNRHTGNPVPESSVSTSGELRGDPLHESHRNRNQKNGESEEVQRDTSHELPEWLQEFREILIESSSTEPWGDPEQGSQDTFKSSHGLPMESRAKVEPGSGKHSVHTHFPKDPNRDICLKTKITRSSCERCTGAVVPRAENFGDLITADHKILSENCESRNNHRYAVVVQDLATRWIQSYPCKNGNFSRNTQEVAKVLGAE